VTNIDADLEDAILQVMDKIDELYEKTAWEVVERYDYKNPRKKMREIRGIIRKRVEGACQWA
jgi:hypothetical protein